MAKFVIAKFGVSRCVFKNFNGLICAVNHLIGGGVNANHNATHSPSLAHESKIENDR